MLSFLLPGTISEGTAYAQGSSVEMAVVAHVAKRSFVLERERFV